MAFFEPCFARRAAAGSCLGVRVGPKSGGRNGLQDTVASMRFSD